MEKVKFDEKIERMIQISKEKPLLPESFIPWADMPNPNTLFMPEKLVSLQGHDLWQTLTKEQQIELGKLEVVQVMYSYAWSETLACYFFNRHLLTLNPDSVEYRFLIREIIEEFRHQEMFGMAIRKLERVPVLPSRLHKFFAYLTVRWLPPSMVFMSVLSVEFMADTYAKHIRKDENVFSVMRKSSELHHIEEGRHIFYTESWLEKYTQNAGFLKSSAYSILVLLNVYFMRSLYIQECFFTQIGVKDSSLYYKSALKNYNQKFSTYALSSVIEFVTKINGFNWLTKIFWSRILKVKV